MISENIKLINGDCMKVMAKYPDKYFDLAIVDPPYGIGISKNPPRQKHEKKHGTIQYQMRYILKNCLGFQKIKLFGGVTILFYRQRNALFFGIRKTQSLIFQTESWRELLLKNQQVVLILDIMVILKGKRLLQLKYIQRKNQLSYTIGYTKITHKKDKRL